MKIMIISDGLRFIFIYGLMLCCIAVECNSIYSYELVNDASLRRNVTV